MYRNIAGQTILKKFLLTVSILAVSAVSVFALQKTFTQHRVYFNAIGSGDGKIYFLKHESEKNWDLWRMDGDGTNVIRITNDIILELGGDIFPDKSKIVLLKKTEDYDYIYTANVDGTGEQKIYTTTDYITYLRVSPDGTKIAFTAFDPIAEWFSVGTLYLMNVDGSGVRTLSCGNVTTLQKLASDVSVQSYNPFQVGGSTLTKDNVYSGLSFSPDSSEICFVRYTDRHLVRVDITGTSLVEITTFTVSNSYWLKTGKIVLYDEIGYPDCKLATINPDGTGYSVLYSTSDYFYFSVSPDENKFIVYYDEYISGGGYNNYVTIISAADGSILNNITFTSDDYLSGYTWLTDTQLIYSDTIGIHILDIERITPVPVSIVNDGIGSAYIIDAEASKVIFEQEDKIYAIGTDGSDKILLFDETDMESIYAYGLELSPDGSKIMYEFEEDENVFKLLAKNTDGTGGIITIDEECSYYGSYEWSPNGTKIMYYCGSPVYEYLIANPDGTDKKQIIPDGDWGSYFIFSPDGKKIMFVSQMSSWGHQTGIYITPVDLSTYTLVLAGSYAPRDWKSDKVLITDDPEIYVMNSDGSGKKFLDNGYYYYCKLSPDGRKLAYEGMDSKLYVMDIEKGITTKSELSDNAYEFDWSKDSQKITYSYYSERGLFTRIYVANSDGSNPYNLNLKIQLFTSNMKFVSNNRLVYEGDYDIWCGDYFAPIPVDIVIPEEKGEIKVVVPEGAGERGTINPDRGGSLSIGFKGNESGTYTMRIFTLFGEQIYTETIEADSAEGWFEWMPEDLASGIYVVHIKGPGVDTFKKVPLLR